MKVLVTGGAGFIGSQLTQQLTDSYVLDLNYGEVQGDIRNVGRENCPFEGHKSLVRSTQAVVHLAALTGKKECASHPQLAREVNITGTENMLDFCRRNDVSRFVMASTCACYCERDTLYVKTKLAGEKLCREYSEKYDIPSVVLRLANVYGLGAVAKKKLTVIPTFLLKGLLGDPLPVEGDGQQTRDFVHVEDVCQAFTQALDYGEHDVFFVGTGRETSINQLAEIFTEKIHILYGKQVSVVHREYPPWRSKVGRVQIPVAKTTEKLGWQPQITLEEGIESLVMFPYG